MLHIQNSLLLAAALLISSCQGQTPAGRLREGIKTDAESPHPRIIRTQGTQSGIIRCELCDKNGDLWFSISGEGAYRYDGTSFTQFTTRDGLCSNQVGAIIQDRQGNFLFGTSNGICKYDGQQFTRYPVPDTLSITCLLEDKAGNLWFGTHNNGIYRYDGKTLENFLSHPKPGESFNLGSNYQLILNILQDRNGNIWFSSWNGGGVWVYDGKAFKNFLPPPEYYRTNQDRRNPSHSQNTLDDLLYNAYTPSKDHITDDMIFSMAEDKAGNIWFATRNHGACRYDGKTFTTFGAEDGFSSRGAYAILEDSKGNLWFTTEKDGVWRYDGQNLKNYTEKDGLVANAVVSILEDKQGYLWFGTKWLGLSRYDGARFVTFSE